jgi:hypothetical protein
VIHNCNMLCDQQPCQNGGACLEDFRSNTYHCDCEMTSYSGFYCTEGRLCYVWNILVILVMLEQFSLRVILISKSQLLFNR